MRRIAILKPSPLTLNLENDDFDAPTPSSSVLPVVANRGQWDDEDQDDEVKESWEASDASGDDGESKTPLSATLTSNTKKKMTLKEKIVEREAEAKKMKIDAERKKVCFRGWCAFCLCRC